MKYYISIHDVSPENISIIENIVNILNLKYNIKKLSLLIIPGLDWNKNQIDKLKYWQTQGIQIAAHGWTHVSQKKKSFFHIIHSFLISKDCAEHLSKKRSEIVYLINKSYNWFIKNNFESPILYVPPAWALGKLNRKDIVFLPFKIIECTTGMLHKGEYRFLPLIGFEAKTRIRAHLLKFFNGINFILGRLVGIVRITVHPNDFNLLLSDDANMYLKTANNTVFLNELINEKK